MTRASVAVVTTYYRPVLGGAEAAAERLATFLQRRGHPVTVLTKRTNPVHAAREILDDVAIERVGPIGERSGAGKWQVLPAVFLALRRHRKETDVICCVDYRGVGLAALAARALSATPVVFQAQTEDVISAARVRRRLGRAGIAPDGAVARLITWPVRAVYGRADAIGCISRGIERETLAAGVPRDRVYYLPNPIDTRRFSPATPLERETLRATLGIAPDAVVATFVGRLSREKGVIELVQAWGQARPSARLVVIGPPMTGHAWDVSAEARSIVDQHGLDQSIQFVGGQPTERVAAWLKASDLAIQPSHFEAMGLAAAEAMAAGLPVIATDTGGYRDFVKHEDTGLLVPVGDVPALARAIVRLVNDAALRRQMGAKAREMAQQFDEQIVLERFAQIIDRLAAHR